MFRAILITAFLAPGLAFAKGGDDKPPKPTQTTKNCQAGKIWDKRSSRCVRVKSEVFDDDTLYQAVRELAYAGRLQDAQTVLSAMSDQGEDRVLTYWGFTHRKMGDVATGMTFYEQAIAANPANILSRSYMGQAFVEMGDMGAAREQLQEIRAHGGAGTWAEQSLAQAIQSGSTYNY